MDGALRPPPHDQGQSPIRPRLTRMLQPLRTPTGEPNEFVREIHTRMPVILHEKQHDAWLLGEASK